MFSYLVGVGGSDVLLFHEQLMIQYFHLEHKELKS